MLSTISKSIKRQGIPLQLEALKFCSHIYLRVLSHALSGIKGILPYIFLNFCAHFYFADYFANSDPEFVKLVIGNLVGPLDPSLIVIPQASGVSSLTAKSLPTDINSLCVHLTTHPGLS